MNDYRPSHRAFTFTACALALACSTQAAPDDTNTDQGSEGGAGGSAAEDTDAQLPPADAAAMEVWLEEGHYLEWDCEPEPTVKSDGARAIHVHVVSNRVCSNALLASSAIGEGGQFPRGVASVKEVYDAGGRLTAHAVAVKIADDSAGGDGWYWYEGAAHAGNGHPSCTGCHGAAASDADHTGAGDFVYFRVPATE